LILSTVVCKEFLFKSWITVKSVNDAPPLGHLLVTIILEIL